MTILEGHKFEKDRDGQYLWVNQPSGHFVYVIESAIGTVKVGHAKNPRSRLRALTHAQAYKLNLRQAFMLPDKRMAQVVEKAAHDRFQDHQLRGEWFSLPAKAAEIGVCLEIKALGYCWTTLEQYEKHCEHGWWEAEKRTAQALEALRQNKSAA